MGGQKMNEIMKLYKNEIYSQPPPPPPPPPPHPTTHHSTTFQGRVSSIILALYQLLAILTYYSVLSN